jgi:hypothetical protein
MTGQKSFSCNQVKPFLWHLHKKFLIKTLIEKFIHDLKRNTFNLGQFPWIDWDFGIFTNSCWTISFLVEFEKLRRVKGANKIQHKLTRVIFF